ncbi:MAG: 50S ribosomal protein L23 [Chloroflexi bacterium]|nr:50S ribosomal protein L23 [Chloroflexota bacterium]
MHAYEVLLRPLITEKHQAMSEASRYAFEVASAANKPMIKEAVELAFPQVKVVAVNTLMVRGKSKRVGTREVHRPPWKKAVVTLRDGDHIEFFEGV